MQSNIIQFFEQFISDIDVGMTRDIKAFLGGEEDILMYNLSMDENRTIIVSIRLKEYSSRLAKALWERFQSFIGYEYLNLFLKEESDGLVRYNYITTHTDMSGVRINMEIRE